MHGIVYKLEHNNNMANTIAEKKPEATKEAQPKLDVQIRRNKDEKWVSSTYRGNLPSLTREQLNTAIDLNVIDPVAIEMIQYWYDGAELDKNVVPAWMINPEDSKENADAGGDVQATALDLPLFEPLHYRKAFKRIDLEHRKVTPEKGEVAEWVETERSEWDAEFIAEDGSKGRWIKVMDWNSNGKKLFKSKDYKNLYNFVIQCNTLLDLEPAMDEKRQKFIAEGGRTVRLDERKQKMVQVLEKPLDKKSNGNFKMNDGSEYTSEQIEELVKSVKKHNPELLQEDTNGS